jgi:hypothetical protein
VGPDPDAPRRAGHVDERRHPRVVVVQDRHVVRALPLEDAQLGGRVRRLGAVPVQVVRRDVEQPRRVGPETVHVLELERGELERHDRPGRERRGDPRQGGADVACHHRRKPFGGEHRADQLHGGRLAVRPGHRHDAAAGRQEPKAELDLAPHRQTAASAAMTTGASPARRAT